MITILIVRNVNFSDNRYKVDNSSPSIRLNLTKFYLKCKEAFKFKVLKKLVLMIESITKISIKQLLERFLYINDKKVNKLQL